MELGQAFEIGGLSTSIAFLVQLLVNFFTAAWPTRPSWAGYLAAIVAGIGGSFLVAMANRVVVDQAIAAQLVIIGLGAAGMAAGVSYQTVRVEARREAATGESASEPPMNEPVERSGERKRVKPRLSFVERDKPPQE